MLASLMARLSDSEAIFLSNVCEFVAVIAGVVLVIGLIGEFPESEVWKQSVGYKLAKCAVIAGVAFEIIGGAGVFGTSTRLQQLTDASLSQRMSTERSMLEQLKPRSVSPEAHDILVAALKGKLNAIRIFVPEDVNEETWRYATEISFALADAGVRVNFPPDRVTPQMKAVTPIPMSGIELVIKPDTPEGEDVKNWLPQALSESLKLVGGAFPISSNAQYLLVPNVALFVMPKPIPFGWFWDDFETARITKPADWKGDWPPKPPWEPK